MKLTIEVCDGMPCSLKTFTVNNIGADTNDFGYTDWERSKFYECKNHRFIGYTTPTPEVLEKYNINETEFNSICYNLQKALYIDSCSLCR